MKFTIDIDLSSNDAKAFVDYLRSLQFVRIEEDSTQLDDNLRAGLEQGLQSLDNGTRSHEEVMHETRAKFPHLFNKRA